MLLPLLLALDSGQVAALATMIAALVGFAAFIAGQRRQVSRDRKEEAKDRESEQVQSRAAYIQGFEKLAEGMRLEMERLLEAHAGDREAWKDEKASLELRMSLAEGGLQECLADRGLLKAEQIELKAQIRFIGAAMVGDIAGQPEVTKDLLRRVGIVPRGFERREDDEGPPEGVPERRAGVDRRTV